MTDELMFDRLFRKTLVALGCGCLAVLICYFFVDRTVAYYVHDQHFSSDVAIKWLTYPPPLMQAWVPVMLVALMIRRVWGPFRRWEWALIAAGVAMVLADQFRETLAYTFGRYWPETWINNNPSLIQNGAYGFHPFHDSSAYGSFPSGHASRTLAVGAVVWVAYPKWRWAVVVVSFLLSAALVGMNYHFVSDVIGGAIIGSIVGVYTAKCCGIR